MQRRPYVSYHYEYKCCSEVELEDNEAQAAWAAAAAKISGGRIKAKKENMEEQGKHSNIGDQTPTVDSVERQLREQGDD